jgi:hypothetical protein
VVEQEAVQDVVKEAAVSELGELAKVCQDGKEGMYQALLVGLDPQA